MKLTIKQLKQLIKEQVDESTRGGTIYDDDEYDPGPSGREERMMGQGGSSNEELLEFFADARARLEQAGSSEEREEAETDYEELKQEILSKMG